MSMAGKTVIITGASRGIGLAALNLFAENGARLYACYRTGNPEFEAHLARLSERYGADIQTLRFDLAEQEELKAAVKTIAAAKKADILINCAGMAHGGLFQMTPLSEMRAVFEANYFGQILFAQSVARIMMRQKSGIIVNVASAAGIDGRAGNIAYGASKSALILATKTMANELAPFGIRVNAVAPGIIDTDMLRLMEEKAKNEMLASCAMKRIGSPDEVAQTIFFLASDMSSYITGQVLRVDGGM